MAPPSPKRYDKKELCEAAQIECEDLERYIEMGLLFDRGGGFSDTELEILRILQKLEAVDPDGTLLETYREHARAVAEVETDLARRLTREHPGEGATVKALFDATLILKPYLFNMEFYERYRQKVHEESSP